MPVTKETAKMIFDSGDVRRAKPKSGDNNRPSGVDRRASFRTSTSLLPSVCHMTLVCTATALDVHSHGDYTGFVIPSSEQVFGRAPVRQPLSQSINNKLSLNIWASSHGSI